MVTHRGGSFAFGGPLRAVQSELALVGRYSGIERNRAFFEADGIPQKVRLFAVFQFP